MKTANAAFLAVAQTYNQAFNARDQRFFKISHSHNVILNACIAIGFEVQKGLRIFTYPFLLAVSHEDWEKTMPLCR